MNSLIAINTGNIGDQTVQTVNARDLHAFLQIGKDFNTWVKDRVDSFGFVENQDFVITEGLRSPNSGSAKARTQKVKDYHLTLDMAKELSMVERNEKGKQARQYFIECERQAKESHAQLNGNSSLLSIMATLQQATEMIAKETFTHIATLRNDLDELKQSLANPATGTTLSYTEGWKPTHTIIPKNPDNILYKKFVEICGPGGNLQGWWRKSGLKLSAYTLTRILYQDAKPAPATFATIAVALGMTKDEIKTHLQANYKNCGFLALL